MTTLSLTEIARAVGREWGVRFEDMRRNWRNAWHREVPAVTARSVAMWLAKLEGGHAMRDICPFFGLRDDAAFRRRVTRVKGALGLVTMREAA
jgi:chromosomal replication initiation ATPase DnaA